MDTKEYDWDLTAERRYAMQEVKDTIKLLRGTCESYNMPDEKIDWICKYVASSMKIMFHSGGISSQMEQIDAIKRGQENA